MVLVSVALSGRGQVARSPSYRRLNQTLLPTTVVVHSDLSRDGLPLIKNVLGPEGRRKTSRVAKQKKIIDSKQRADFRKNLCLALIFAFHMACSIYIGIKVIVLISNPPPRQFCQHCTNLDLSRVRSVEIPRRGHHQGQREIVLASITIHWC